MTVEPPRLRCRGIRKSFPGVQALDDVRLEVARGEIHAIVGENGAGKSTLVKILSGAINADSGTIELDGNRVTIHDAGSAIQHGIAIVYQEFTLAADLSVAENIFLGRWPRSKRTGCIDFARLNNEAAKVLGSLNINLPVDRPVSGLSVAQQQMVEIAKALSLEARVLILDEPSAVLTPHELETLFSLVRDLARRGVSIIYISHRLDEIFDIADTVTVLRDGLHISTTPIADTNRNRLISEMVGRSLKDEFPSRSCTVGEVLLRVEGLCVATRVHDVSFTVRAGEVFAITGLVGSGRTSVVQAVFGAERASSGAVFVGEFAGPFSSPKRGIAAGIAMLPEDRKRDGLLMERSLRENVTLANLHANATAGLLHIKNERKLTSQLMDDLSIRAVSTESSVSTLSGGNQQKVMLARWMSRPHKVILFDEPTRGVDVGAKVEIYELINALAGEGVAVVLVSSELPEVIGMADRIGVMHEGRLVAILDNEARNVTQEQIMRLASGEDQSQ